jgi:hypothetical protein
MFITDHNTESALKELAQCLTMLLYTWKDQAVAETKRRPPSYDRLYLLGHNSI